MAHRVPILREVSLTQDVTHNLNTLLAAIDSDIPNRCSGIQIQFDPTAGASKLFIGNGTGDISADRGTELVATQAWSISFESNIIMTSDISIRTDGTGLVALITMVVR